MIELRTLGAVNLVSADGSEIRAVLTQAKRLALLAYLVIVTPRGFHRRDTLLGMFWPDLDQRHARASLRKAVHVVRRALGPGVLVARGDEELAVAAGSLWCDAVAFEAAFAERRFVDALKLYNGQLLPGFFVTGAPEFEQWLERERARLKDLAAQAAWTLAEAAVGEHRAGEAARWGRWAAALTPFDEDALRNLVSLLYRVGDRAEALRAYDEFAERLARDLGVRPSAETRRLRDTVKMSGDFDVTAPG